MKKIYMYILVMFIVFNTTIVGSFGEKQVDLNINDIEEEISLVTLKNYYKILRNKIKDVDFNKSPEKDLQDKISKDKAKEESVFEVSKYENMNNRQLFNQKDYLEFYEIEPNNNIHEANLLERNYSGENGLRVFGTITDYYFDMDFYRIDVATYGTFDILGVWLGDYYEFGWEDDLKFSLKDSKGDTIQWSNTKVYRETMFQHLKANVSPGTYYLSVMQISDYEYLYLGEWYGLDVLFEPSSVPVSGVSLNKKNLTLDLEKLENKERLLATVTPANATDKKIFWESSNTNIATVSDEGVVTPVGPGVSVITATTNDGSYKANCVVTVISSLEEWEVWESKYNVIPNKTWTIDFNKMLDIKTIKEKNIYVTDKDDTILPMFYYQLNQDIDKKIYVMPVRQYESGQRYTLWIKDLKALDGSVLSKKVKMDFIIK